MKVKLKVKSFYRSLILTTVLALTLTACSSSTANTLTKETQSAPVSSDSGSMPASDSTSSRTYNAGALTLVITSPQDNAEVTEPQINLEGSISENAVMTVNDEIYLLDSGNFSQSLSLQEGANVLQIVVSDDTGNEIDLILTVTYSPD